ncbi:hypothetical protein QLV94_08365 [Streptococcus equi subsp. zooepidemicus]|nr:hypothetical protein [Streptococcus equi]MDI5952943.1 hypothetical protein [Streptococcus equi subsp. zooepidemicus]MDI6074721.1 hypothetical protein [Streptococcus equi subsp. zooepidemicus]
MLSKQKLSLEISHYLISGLLTTILYLILRYVIYIHGYIRPPYQQALPIL